MDVVDEDDQRTLVGEVFQRAAERPDELLLGGGRLESDESDESARDRRGLRESGDEGLDALACRVRVVAVIDPRRLPDDLGDRPIRDALAVGEATAADDQGSVADGSEELGHEAALTHAGRTEDREQLARPIRHRALECVPERLELAFASDHRRIEVTTVPVSAGRDVTQPVGDDGLGFALELDRRGRADLHRIAHQVPRGAADHDLARRGRGLEPGGDVDGVADDDRLTRPAGADHDGSGIDPRSRLECHAALAPQGDIEPIERVAHLCGGSHGAQAILLVDHGYPEHGHHRVADVLLDRSTVAFDDLAHAREVAAHHVPQRLRVEPLAERSRARHVGEQDGHHLACLALRRGGREQRAAEATMPEAHWVLFATGGAAIHGRSVGRPRRRS